MVCTQLHVSDGGARPCGWGCVPHHDSTACMCMYGELLCMQRGAVAYAHSGFTVQVTAHTQSLGHGRHDACPDAPGGTRTVTGRQERALHPCTHRAPCCGRCHGMQLQGRVRAGPCCQVAQGVRKMEGTTCDTRRGEDHTWHKYVGHRRLHHHCTAERKPVAPPRGLDTEHMGGGGGCGASRQGVFDLAYHILCGAIPLKRHCFLEMRGDTHLPLACLRVWLEHDGRPRTWRQGFHRATNGETVPPCSKLLLDSLHSCHGGRFCVVSR